MRRNKSTIVVRSQYELDGEFINAQGDDDCIVVLGSDIAIRNCTISDTTGSGIAHRDAIQLIPKESEPNSQFCGAIANGLSIEGNEITSNGKLQGIFASDGGFSELICNRNRVTTNSHHQITINGVLNGTFISNNAHIVLDNMRIGGSHPRAFYVKSFVDHSYEVITERGNKSFTDNRGINSGVTNFDLLLFRECSKLTVYKSFASHFEETLDLYYRHMRESREVDMGLPEGDSLSKVISSHEGHYRSFNRGKAGDAGNADMPMLTIGAYIERGELPFGHPIRIHAMGKYQFITETLKDALRVKVVHKDELLTPKVQERIFIEWLMLKKRKRVARYIATGNGFSTAMRELAKEWASIADPDTGRSYWDKNGNDKAHTTRTEIGNAMRRARAGYLVFRENGAGERASIIDAIYH